MKCEVCDKFGDLFIIEESDDETEIESYESEMDEDID